MSDHDDTASAEGAETGKRIPLLDASAVPDFDQIEAGWKATLDERERLEADAQRAFRSEPGSQTPVSVVESAEGSMLFPGLHVSNNNGPLSKVARAALQAKFPAGAEPPAEQDP